MSSDNIAKNDVPEKKRCQKRRSRETEDAKNDRHLKGSVRLSKHVVGGRRGEGE